jgi:glycosyltransferase domain-containing protein/putative glycosyltransferase (TIGR04372 family)
MYTLIIPPHNRPEDFDRQLNYLSRVDFCYQILIADSSDDIDLMKSICQKYSNLNIKYYGYPGLTYPKKVVEILDHVETEYFSMVPDDDIINSECIEECLEILRENQGINIVHGTYIGFERINSKKIIFDEILQSSSSAIMAESSKERIIALSLSYNFQLYGVMRTQQQRQIFKKSAEFSSLMFWELSHAYLNAAQGKIARIDKVFHFRQRAPSVVIPNKTHLIEFYVNYPEEFHQSILKLSNLYNQIADKTYSDGDLIQVFQYMLFYNNCININGVIDLLNIKEDLTHQNRFQRILNICSGGNAEFVMGVPKNKNNKNYIDLSKTVTISQEVLLEIGDKLSKIIPIVFNNYYGSNLYSLKNDKENDKYDYQLNFKKSNFDIYIKSKFMLNGVKSRLRNFTKNAYILFDSLGLTFIFKLIKLLTNRIIKIVISVLSVLFSASSILIFIILNILIPKKSFLLYSNGSILNKILTRIKVNLNQVFKSWKQHDESYLYRGAINSISILLKYMGVVTASVGVNRIGHLIAELDYAQSKKYKFLVVFSKEKVCNELILHIFIDTYPNTFYIDANKLPNFIYKVLLHTNIKLDLYPVATALNIPNYSPILINKREFLNSQSFIEGYLKSSQNKLGELLEGLKIEKNEDWYVCFHECYRGFGANDDQKQAFRDFNIEEYENSIKYITSLGGKVVRMGSRKTLTPTKLGDVIDYSNSGLQSEENDILLYSGCRFVVCGTSGLFMVPSLLKKPILMINTIPAASHAFSSRCISMPKLVYSNGQLLDPIMCIDHTEEDYISEKYKYENITDHMLTEELVEFIKNLNDEVINPSSYQVRFSIQESGYKCGNAFGLISNISNIKYL